MKAQTSIVVKKFGGTSVGSIERIEAVAERVAKGSDIKQVIVVSAMSGETNRLIQLAHQIDPSYHGPAYDMLLASGEQVSVALLSMALRKRGVKAVPLLAYQLGIQTDDIFSKAKIQSIEKQRILDVLTDDGVPVVAGFQGMSGMQITTLGRGGSDTTAVALAATLESPYCEIYTDVPAVFTADPRLVERASEIPELSFEEMMEMSSLGSKVLHFRCVELAAKYNVRLHVRSSFLEREGTWIFSKKEDSVESPVVSSVTHDPSTAVFKMFPVPRGAGFLTQLFEELSRNNVVVDIITQSHGNEDQRVAFSVPEEDVNLAQECIQKKWPHIQPEILKNMSKISIIGVGMRNHQGVAARFFKVFDRLGVEPHLVTTSDIKISAVVQKEKLQDIATSLHTEFGLDKN